MKTYTIDRAAFSDVQFYELIKIQEMQNLPSEYCDIFDRDGEIAEEYQDIFNVDAYELSHDNVRITDYETLEKFLLDYALTPKDLDEDIQEFIASYLLLNDAHNTDYVFQVAGDGDGLGFIVDVWDNPEYENDPIGTLTIWFEDYDM